uniref:Predicted protein n=1 Tax=Hordeum vulgare subsp. vulgare TaxID=112509 RepID=F2DBD2_HORVV|nr:predicted protein [Hordeum vulgare subsp. vulgare]
MALATAAAPPAIAAATSTSFPSLPSLLQHHLPGSRRTVTTSAFARRFRSKNPSPFRSGSKAAAPAPAPAPALEDDFGGLEGELWRLRRRAELRFQRLAAEADEAYGDLRSCVRDVGGDRVVLTFRRSSLRFAALALLWSLALSAAAWASLGLALRAWRQLWGRGWGDGPEGGAVVTKRDRSMGGKEVVVSVSSPVLPPASRVKEPARKVRRKEPQGRVPEWWPEMETELVELGQEAERWAILANRLVRGECLYISETILFCF